MPAKAGMHGFAAAATPQGVDGLPSRAMTVWGVA
jgi:hypothetical protein